MDSVSFYAMCMVTSFKEDIHEDSMQFPSQNSQFLCNRPDRPLKASGRPAVSRNFSVEDVRTSEQYRPDELDFRSRHYLGSFYKTSGRRGNTSGRCLAFQNILSFLFECRKELWRRPSGRGPCYGSFQCYFEKAVAVDRPDARSSRPDALQYFDHNFLLKYQIGMKLVSLEN
jgi:hypothetical protein